MTYNKTLGELQVEVENVKEQHLACQARLNSSLEQIYNKIDELNEKLLQRLPLWATILFGIMLSIIGYLARG